MSPQAACRLETLGFERVFDYVGGKANSISTRSGPPERERTQSRLASEGILHADAPTRVTRRLARLNGDWTLARALEQTPPGATVGRSLPTPQPACSRSAIAGAPIP